MLNEVKSITNNRVCYRNPVALCCRNRKIIVCNSTKGNKLFPILHSSECQRTAGSPKLNTCIIISRSRKHRYAESAIVAAVNHGNHFVIREFDFSSDKHIAADCIYNRTAIIICSAGRHRDRVVLSRRYRSRRLNTAAEHRTCVISQRSGVNRNIRARGGCAGNKYRRYGIRAYFHIFEIQFAVFNRCGIARFGICFVRKRKLHAVQAEFCGVGYRNFYVFKSRNFLEIRHVLCVTFDVARVFFFPTRKLIHRVIIAYLLGRFQRITVFTLLRTDFVADFVFDRNRIFVCIKICLQSRFFCFIGFRL